MVRVAVAGQRVGLAAQPAELVQVDDVRIHVEFVTPGPADQPDTLPDGLAQRGTEPGDVDGQALPGLWRRLGIPDPVDEHVSGHDCARSQHEDGQDTPRPGRPELALLPSRPELNRPEHPEFHDRLHVFWLASQLTCWIKKLIPVISTSHRKF